VTASGYPNDSGPYGSAPSAPSPYQRAAQVWDDRIGSSTAQARAWRWMAFIAISLAAATSTALIVQSGKVQIKTYVVPINEVGRPGRVEALGDHYQPTTASAAYFVAEFVRNVRSRSVDPMVVRDNWLRAYALAAGDALPALDAYAKLTAPLVNVGDQSVVAEIASVLPRSPRTFEVNWREVRSDRNGGSSTSRWTGVFTTEVVPPKDEAELRANPLGLRIVNFQWSREL